MFKHGVDDKDVMVGYLQSKLREASVLWAVVVMRWKDQLQKLRRQRQHQSDQRTVCQHCSVLHQHTLQSSLAGLTACNAPLSSVVLRLTHGFGRHFSVFGGLGPL